MAKTFTHKLGKTRAGEGTRVWLEGQRLAQHGFTHGETFARIWRKDRLILRIITAEEFAALPRNERGTVAGSIARPIIDIVGEQVAKTFPSGIVAVTYGARGITIVGA